MKNFEYSIVFGLKAEKNFPKDLKDSVLIVDEPEAGLSLSNQKKVFDDFKSLTKRISVLKSATV